MKIGIIFDNPNDVMTFSGVASFEMDVKEPSIFKSKKTLKAMDKNSFEGGKTSLQGEVPPIIKDKE